MSDRSELVDEFRAGSRTALARVISRVEDRAPGFEELLDRILSGTERGDHAHRIGLTGPPGAGKSTLAGRLVRAYRERDERVAVVAVDPTSPFSGGALLGDRIRMADVAMDDGVFIRSMASRNALGGMATTTREVLDILEAFGFDRILAETVGVGQTDLEIAGAADTVVVALVPESGDGVQAMKAGLLEIADVFVVNKADRPGADRLVRELREAVELRTGAGGHPRDTGPSSNDSWPLPVLQTVATAGDGVDELVESVDAHREWLESSGVGDERRRARVRSRIREVVEREALARLWAGPEAPDRLDAGVDAVIGGSESVYSAARRVVDHGKDQG